ncbi:MAG: PAS domain S-box protein [Anaeromyxobacter sp.]|nr:PAS domain S-box protein [Anaeromyxobacter sp.]MBL0278667.1 PAS domain S-box protein [Anaeromyxobacter sp.]
MIRDAEWLFQTLYEHSPEGVLLSRIDGTILRANRTACQLLGRTEADLRAAGRADLAEPTPELAAQVEQRARTGSAAGRALLRRADGTSLPVDFTSVIVPTAEAQVPLAILIFRDATAAEATARLLQEADQSARALRLLTACNEALVRAPDEAGLLQEVCRAAVEEGGFRLAWVGQVDEEDGRRVLPVARHGVDEGYVDALVLSTDAADPRGRGPTGVAARERRVVVDQDHAADPDFTPWLDEARRRGYAGSAAVPIVHEGTCLGVLCVYAGETGAFPPPVVTLLTRLAGDLGRGLTALRTRALLEAVLDHAPVAITVRRLDGRITLLNRRAARIQGAPAPALLGRNLADLVDAEGRAHMLEGQARVLATGEPTTYLLRGHTAAGHYALDVSLFPLREANGRISSLGAVGVDVLERERVEERLRLSREVLRELFSRLDRAREEEKARFARDLHDEMGQLLTALKVDLLAMERRLETMPGIEAGELLDRVVGASELAGQAVQAVQRIAAELRPAALDRLGLDAALRQEARAFQGRTGVTCEVEGAAGPADLTPDQATALYRIAQEALTNVARHAGATRVLVTIEAGEDEVTVVVEDDGRGLGAAAEGLGLTGMRERAERLGGSLAVGPGAGPGTRVRVRLPRRLAGPAPA